MSDSISTQEPGCPIVDKSDKDEKEALENIDLAGSLMEECKAGLSLSNLDTAVALFREVLDDSKRTRTVHADAMRGLASALGLRFMYTGTSQMDDLKDSLKLRLKIAHSLDLGQDISRDTVGQEDEVNTEDTLQLAKRLLAETLKSVSLQIVNTVILLVQQLLAHLSPSSTTRIMALTTLADALYVRFNHFHDNGVSDINEAISSLQEAVDCSVEKDGQLSNLGFRICALLAVRFEFTGNISELRSALAWMEKGDSRGTKIATGIMQRLEFADDLYEQYEKSGDIDDLNTAVALYREGIVELSKGSEEHIATINNLAVALKIRRGQGGQGSDLDDALALHKQALELRPPPHTKHSESLNNLANTLLARFTQSGRRSDLDEAISFYRQALRLQLPLHPNRSMSFNNLANSLWTRFLQGGERKDLDEAISLHRQALELRLPPHPLRSNSLDNLACALRTQFEQQGQQSDLDEAISLYRQALDLRPQPNPLRPMSLNNLACTLLTRFEQGGDQNDINEAISLHKQALELFPPLHPNRASALNNLAFALCTRFNLAGSRNDLNDAIFLHRQALELFISPHPDRHSSLNNLANTLLARFEQGGGQSDLVEAIAFNREALELLPLAHPNRSRSLNNLASALWSRFQERGERSDLDEAISLHRQALDLCPPPHTLRSSFLNSLASVLWTRFEQQGQRSDLDEVISLYRQALELQLAPHPLRSMSLNNLAITLKTRFEHGGEENDINEAISFHRQALELFPLPHPNRSSGLNNLAFALWARYNRQGNQNDLNEAISLHRQALKLFPVSHFKRSTSLNNLANTLFTRFARSGDKIDLRESVSLHKEALELFLLPHPNRFSSLYSLAIALCTEFEQGERNDLDEAMTLFASATEYPYQPPSTRLRISKRWIQYADRHHHSSAIVAYEAALRALPQLAALSLDVQSRQNALTADSDGLARDACRRAIRSGNLEKAIEFLESGRSIFWSQVLSLRSPFDELRDITQKGSALADKLQHIANQLEIGSHRDVSAEILDNRKRLSIDQEASRMNRLNEEWVATILEVRKLAGFENFLQPLRFSTLQMAASKHPIILLVANDDESNCLVMTSTTIHHIRLPNLRTPILKVLVDNIRTAVSQSPIARSFIDESRQTIDELLGEGRGISYQNDSEGSDGIFKFVLKMLWDELVKTVIDLLNIKKSDTMTVLQWCPTGYFTFLPIHAAGCYDDDLAIDCAPDYFISSYTPTIATLLAEAPAPKTFQMMAVIQFQELPSTKEELKKIQQYLPSDALIQFGVPGSPARVEEVASRLPAVSIVHFACHGTQDLLKPLDSGLKLDDGRLTISRIMREQMPNGSLAFLCACETAMGDETLPDEAMSLGASLLFSGFQKVVATMWAMRDEDGPTVADAFYRELFYGSDGQNISVPDVTKSVYALHTAVKKLRSSNMPFRRWVPFVHMGK